MKSLQLSTRHIAFLKRQVLAAILFPLISGFYFTESHAQGADNLPESNSQYSSTTPFDRSSGFGNLPASVSLPPQHSNENWEGGIGMPGVEGEIRTLVWNGGTLYVGGEFVTAAGIYANHIARWDGSSWQPLGSDAINGVDGDVRAIAVDGDKVYVGGQFTLAGGIRVRNIAVWDRSTNTWSALGGGVGGLQESVVNAIAVHNGQVYAAGRFIAAGKVVAVNIARWDGQNWQRVGTGINDAVQAMYIDGNSLYAAGGFTIAGDIRAQSLARYNLSSNTWESTGTTINGTVASITADNQYLYIGGTFETVNGNVVRNIARMNKSNNQWSALGQGIVGEVKAMVVRGNDLIAGGDFNGIFGLSMPTGYEVRRIAKWDGQQWSAFARRSAISGTNHGSSGVIKSSRAESLNDPEAITRDNGEGMIYGLAADDRGDIYIGGSFDLAGPAYVIPGLRPAAYQIFPDAESVIASNICKLSGKDTVWSVLGGGLDNRVYAFADEGTHLYVGGQFLNASGSRVNHITRFNKSTREWEALGSGTNDLILALALNGSNLYAGGIFSSAGGTAAQGVAMWNTGSKSWSRIGTRDFDSVAALAVVNGSLYVGGKHGLARWNGSAWETLFDASTGKVFALVQNGNSLYVAGSFPTVGGNPAKNIAALNITTGQWSAVGGGTDGPVYALSMWNGKLCVGGKFSQAGSVPALNVASWNPTNSQWEALGVGIKGEIRAVTPGRFGLYAAGKFGIVETILSANSVGLWTGSEWKTLGNGVAELIGLATVHALSADADRLYVGGTLQYAGGKTSFYMARWNFPPENLTPDPGNPFAGRQRTSSSAILQDIYPNPVADKMTLHFLMLESGPVTTKIFNARGERLISEDKGNFQTGSQELMIETAPLPEGVYFIRIETAAGTGQASFIVTR